MKWLINWFEAVAVAQQRRADYWLLRNMSDKELRDIGITRGEMQPKSLQRLMRQVIILSLLCASVLLPPLKLVAKVESPDSGAHVRHKWLQSNIKQKVGAINNGPFQITT